MYKLNSRFWLLSYDHTTNYTKEFVGIDTSKFQRSKSFKKDAGEYKKPTEKIESESVTQVLNNFLLIQILFDINNHHKELV
jgi:hypothetical protein